jgi:hypothetical protein
MYNYILFTRFQYFWWCHQDNNHQTAKILENSFSVCRNDHKGHVHVTFPYYSNINLLRKIIEVAKPFILNRIMITTFYLQDFDIFDGAIKTTITKLPQHPFSNLYKTIFPFYYIVLWTLINLKWWPFRNKMAAKCAHFLREKSYFLLFLWCSLSDFDTEHIILERFLVLVFLFTNVTICCFDHTQGVHVNCYTLDVMYVNYNHFQSWKYSFIQISLVFFVRFRPSRYQNDQLKAPYQSLVKINKLNI